MEKTEQLKRYFTARDKKIYLEMTQDVLNLRKKLKNVSTYALKMRVELFLALAINEDAVVEAMNELHYRGLGLQSVVTKVDLPPQKKQEPSLLQFKVA